MSGTTILLIFLAAVAALALSAFQYFYKSKISSTRAWSLAFFRFLALFALMVLLINPKIVNREYYVEKPDLLLAIDNSASISNFGVTEEVTDYVTSIVEDPRIRERFEVHVFPFGRELSQGQDLGFMESQTNIAGAMRSLETFFKNKKAPTLLITDGNATMGRDLIFATTNYSNPIFPVVAGDTTSYRDLALSRVNSNKYAYLNNEFPVEMILKYSGKGAVETQLRISAGGNTVFTRNLSFGENEHSKVVEALLPANRTGITTYLAELLPLEGEQNIENNSRKFAVEVIDERTRVLLVTDFLHPDLGTLKKAIESNKQREVIIHQLSDGPVDPELFQLLILYQPNAGFKNLIEKLREKKRGYWLITGPATDYRVLNQLQEDFRIEITGQTEERIPEANPNFSAYQFEDLGFSRFPPLEGVFGEISLSLAVDPLLYGQVQGISTEIPLLAVTTEAESKKAFLFGADIWKWRSHIYTEEESFEKFDDFIGKLVQLLASDQRKERLSVDYEPLYYGSDKVMISAGYFDRNYLFDPRGSLQLEIRDEKTGNVQKVPMAVKTNRYEADLSSLPAGDYSFKLSVFGEGLARSGKFSLIKFDVEQQFGSANLSGMMHIAEENDTPISFIGDPGKMIEVMLSQEKFTPVQKSRENTVPLIDWYYLLGIIILALAVEWFMRKYYGLI